MGLPHPIRQLHPSSPPRRTAPRFLGCRCPGPRHCIPATRPPSTQRTLPSGTPWPLPSELFRLPHDDAGREVGSPTASRVLRPRLEDVRLHPCRVCEGARLGEGG